MKESTRDKKIKKLFKEKKSVKEIANILNISVGRVLKTLKKTYKPNKEEDLETYFLKSQKIKKEIIKIYRKHYFLESFGKIEDKLNLQKGDL